MHDAGSERRAETVEFRRETEGLPDARNTSSRRSAWSSGA